MTNFKIARYFSDRPVSLFDTICKCAETCLEAIYTYEVLKMFTYNYHLIFILDFQKFNCIYMIPKTCFVEF